MRAFSNYVSEWCGRAVTACGYRVRWPWRPRAAARGYRVPFTRFTRAVAAVTAGGGAVTAAVTAAEYAVAAATACGNRVITRRLRGGREWRFEIENCKFPIPHYQLAHGVNPW